MQQITKSSSKRATIATLVGCTTCSWVSSLVVDMRVFSHCNSGDARGGTSNILDLQF